MVLSVMETGKRNEGRYQRLYGWHSLNSLYNMQDFIFTYMNNNLNSEDVLIGYSILFGIPLDVI